jgi:hypothetical protein
VKKLNAQLQPLQTISKQKDIIRATKWNKENAERRKEIARESARRNYNESPDKYRARSRLAYKILKDTEPHKALFLDARRRARRAGIPFNLDEDDLLIPESCPVLGIPLFRGNGTPSDNSATVDRVIPERGYVKGNVRVISFRANRIKSNASMAEIRRVFEYMQSPEPSSHSLISEDYRKQQEALHATGNYGVMGERYAPLVSQIIDRLKITHLLDYGCGSNCSLARALKVPHSLKYQAYDAGVARFSGSPVPAQMVACIDVLEHIEPDYLDRVLDHLRTLTEGVCFLSVHTGPALKVLSDGRNAHLIQEPMQWWLPKIWERFELQTVQGMEQGFYVIGLAKSQIEDTAGNLL